MVDITQKDNLVVMISGVPKNITVFTIDRTRDKYYMYFPAGSSTKIIIFDNNTMMTAKRTGSNFYPTNVKNLLCFPAKIAEYLLQSQSENSKLYKDFITDDYKCNTPVSELSQYHTKIEYFKHEFPNVDLPASANKIKCDELYTICCMQQYVKPNQTKLLFEQAYRIHTDLPTTFSKHSYSRKETAIKYIYRILEKRIAGPESNNISVNHLISDYINMAVKLNEKIDIQLGKNGIRRLHDAYAIRIFEKMKRKRGNKLQIPDTPLKQLKLPKEFQRLESHTDLLEEQERQHNCVGSYGDRIEAGKCIVYKADIYDEHVTIEIICRKHKEQYRFLVRQCLTRFNDPCKKETLDYVKNQVKIAAQNINNKI